MGSSPLRKDRGFTLMEVIVTLVVLAIAAAAAIPAFLGATRVGEMDRAVGAFEAVFRLARDSAVLTARPVLVTVDSATGAVWMETARATALDGSAATAGDGIGGSFRRMGIASASAPGRRLDLELPGGVEVITTGARAAFRFAPTGAVDADTFGLRDATGRVRPLVLDRWSGHVLEP